MRRNNGKIGAFILFLGIGVAAALFIPSTFCLFVVGAALIIAGILLIRK